MIADKNITGTSTGNMALDKSQSMSRLVMNSYGMVHLGAKLDKIFEIWMNENEKNAATY